MSEEAEGAVTPRESRSGSRRGRGWGRVQRARDAFSDWPAWLRWTVGVPVVVLVLVLTLVAIDVAAAAGRVHPGVAIGPVPVGGMSHERAVAAVTAELEPRLDETVTVVFEESEWEISSSEVSAALDAAGYADEAFRLGREGNLWRRVRDRLSLWIDGAEVAPYVVAETTRTVALLDSFDASIAIAPVDATVEIEGTSVTLVPSAVGLAVNREGATRAVLDSFLAEQRHVDLPTHLVPAAVTDADAQGALEDAQRMLASPLTLAHEDSVWNVEPEQIAGWIGFRAVPHAASEASEASEASAVAGAVEETVAPIPGRMVLDAYLVTTEVSATVTPLTGGVGRAAQDAGFTTSNGVVSIIPGEVGLGVDMASLSDTLEVTLLQADPDDRIAVLRMQAIQPALTTEEAEAMGIEDRIATFTTNFSSANAPRVNNIQVLSKALDGTLVGPGETFSFNDTIGARTADKGYQEAGTIVNGELVPTLGGGICQVCTTLFNTVFFAGLPVEQRSNHSFYISSYPKGRDATVSWGGPDFKFTNDTSAWVLIATGWSSSSVTISLYGTDPGYEVDYSTSNFTSVRPYSTKTVEDPELDEGVRIVEQSGIDGRTVVVTRKVYKNGELVSEDTFSSKYNPKQEVVRVGTRPLPETSEETPTAGN